MPLLDHFGSPLNRTHPWRSFHGAWAATMASLLNHSVFPLGFYAAAFRDRDGLSEIHVTAHRGAVPASTDSPQSWSPPVPGPKLPVDLAAADTVEVKVFADDCDLRLVAVIELVSPRNKECARARQAFALKCVNYLQQGSSVVVFDTVTTQQSDLNAAILLLLGVNATITTPSGLSAVSYRAVGREKEKQRLLLWPASLVLRRRLPTLPLWIAADFSVPLDLQASH